MKLLSAVLIGGALMLKLILANDTQKSFVQDPLEQWIGIAVLYLVFKEINREMDAVLRKEEQ
jgi:hypothetical protein